MLDDLLKKIKAALPEPLKSKFLKKNEDEDEEEYEDEDEDEEGEFDEETDVGVKKSKKPKAVSDDEDEEDDEDDEEEQKKKKKQKLIRAVVAFVLIFIVVDELFLKNNDDDLAQQQLDAAPPPRPVGQKPVLQQPDANPTATAPVPVDATPSAEAIVEEAAPAVSEAVDMSPIETPQMEKETTPPPVENVDSTNLSETSLQEETTEVRENFTWTEPTAEEPIAQDETQNEMQAQASSPIGEAEIIEPGQEDETEEAPSRMGEAASMQPIQQVEIEQVPTKPKDIAGEIAGMISEKVEYTQPPDYAILGRGLVYNCLGKHWACVDRQEYFQCRDNMLWSEQNKKKAECVIRNVYASYEDCKTIQIHYINMAEPADFCD